jgi:hypothetical protein
MVHTKVRKWIEFRKAWLTQDAEKGRRRANKPEEPNAAVVAHELPGAPVTLWTDESTGFRILYGIQYCTYLMLLRYYRHGILDWTLDSGYRVLGTGYWDEILAYQGRA